MSSPPVDTTTLLCADIGRGFSPEQPDWRATAARCDAVFDAAVTAHGGLVERGDTGRHATFGAAVAALGAALAIQRALHAEQAGPPMIRMALHAGPCHTCATLDRARQLLATAHPGQVLISHALHALVHGTLPPDVTLRELGPQRLADLLHPEPLFLVEAPGLPTIASPLRTLDTYTTNLPVQSTPFLGREREVADVCVLVRACGVRAITLVAPSGTGKTRFGLQVAARLLGHFTDGVFFVALAPVSDPALVAPTIAWALGIKEVGGRPILETLKSYLRERKVLLLLDNFEQVLPAAAEVATLLGATARLQVLVTSQAALGITGEQVIPVRPLELPDLAALPPLDHLRRYPAVALFVDRAGRVRPDFSVTPEDAPLLVEICTYLNGLPMALELVAANADRFTLQELLVQIADWSGPLSEEVRPARPYAHTLRRVLDWSYELLCPDEQRLFARLGIFVGGCTLEDADAVCGKLNIEPTELKKNRDKPAMFNVHFSIRGGVAMLRRRNLLLQEEAGGGAVRYVMLDCVHEYAEKRLVTRGEAEALRRQHAAHFLALAEQAEPHLSSPQQQPWLERLEVEHHNLRAALGWASEHDMMVAGRLAGALWRFWVTHSHYGEGRRWLQALINQRQPLPEATRAKVLLGEGTLAWLQGDFAQAVGPLEESVALWRAIGDQRGLGAALNNLGLALREQADYPRAQVYFEESLALRRAIDDTRGVAFALGNLGLVTLYRGDTQRAITFNEESLALFRQLGDTWGTAVALYDLGEVLVVSGDYGRATALLEENLALTHQLGDQALLGHTLSKLGEVALVQGDHRRARQILEQSLVVRRDVGDKEEIAGSLERLAALAAAEGQAARAARLWGAAEVLREALNAPMAPASRALHAQATAAARAQIGEAALAAAWAAGRAMALERAMALAFDGAG